MIPITTNYLINPTQMRVQSILFYSLVLILWSCGDSDPEGFLGEWEGSTNIINDKGEEVLSNITAKISVVSGTTRSCNLQVGSNVYEFIAEENVDELLYNRVTVDNQTDSTVTTYIDGSAELVGDSLVRFDHEIFKMKGSAVLTFENYIWEMKRGK